MRFSPLMLSRSTRGAKKRRPAFGSDASLAESISLVTLCAVIFIGRVSGSLRLAQMEIFDGDDKKRRGRDAFASLNISSFILVQSPPPIVFAARLWFCESADPQRVLQFCSGVFISSISIPGQ